MPDAPPSDPPAADQATTDMSNRSRQCLRRSWLSFLSHLFQLGADDTLVWITEFLINRQAAFHQWDCQQCVASLIQEYCYLMQHSRFACPVANFLPNDQTLRLTSLCAWANVAAVEKALHGK